MWAFLSLLLLLLLAGGLFSQEKAPGKISKAKEFKAVASGAAFLLSSQERDGSWLADPSYRNSKSPLLIAPGANIFTDDTLACTSLCARALLAWRNLGKKRTDRALARALSFLREKMEKGEKRFLTPRTSPIWQAYTLDLLLDIRSSKDPSLRKQKKEVEELLERLLRFIRAGECKGGGWTYTYYDSTAGTPRSFTTALVVRSLLGAKREGLTVPKGLLERGLALLLRSRLETGGYRYLLARPDWPPRVTPMGSIGLMALIEGTLLRGGKAKAEDLEKAVKTFFRYKVLLDQAVEKQTRYGNEGCHVYFAWYHLSEALALLPVPEAKPFKEKAAAFLLSRQRPDGFWWDSRRAGPRAATALALLALASLEGPSK